jgi:undecaprenyl-diphosphatase
VLFSAALLLGLLALTEPVTNGDQWIADQVSGARAGWLTDLFQAVAACTPWWIGLVVSAGTLLLMLARRHAGLPIPWVVTVMLGGWLLTEVLQPAIGRPRPPSDQWLVQVSGSAFPSAHVAFATGCVLAVYGLARSTRYRSPVVAVGTAAVTLVALSRMYLGVNYPTDVLGALLVAAAVRALADAALPNAPAPVPEV